LTNTKECASGAKRGHKGINMAVTLSPDLVCRPSVCLGVRLGRKLARPHCLPWKVFSKKKKKKATSIIKVPALPSALVFVPNKAFWGAAKEANVVTANRATDERRFT
jgi:hypothetical protein